jgi:predicted dienelactone hydrolase
MLLAHGLFSQARDFCGMSAEIASHGYVVFAMDCHSGMCMYTERADGTPLVLNLLWDLAKLGMDYTGIKKSIDIKVAETSEFITEMSEPGFAQKKLGFPANVNLDMTKLIMNGHSLGGGTS